ncbi:unnamed protein product [Dibothriocephalus latus]|uniref:CWF21 domain-containing protein n=1 Tax=Dibothriocephalus latus TaxID=60516 RepID=A0A3P7LZQ9_DIBLA|nr:unnamed protein product [Dibothriocephalus latus]
MYNGIGLATPRGSGTNGYVQKNLAFVTSFKDKINYKTDDDIKRSDAITFKEPNKDILLHEKKRKIEVKCFELQTLMEEQGYTEEEINVKVTALRKQLLSKIDDEDVAPKRFIDAIHPKNEHNPELPRLIPKGTHEIAAVSILKNSVFKDALGISEDYEDGSSMKMAALRRKQAEESRALFEAQKRLQ